MDKSSLFKFFLDIFQYEETVENFFYTSRIILVILLFGLYLMCSYLLIRWCKNGKRKIPIQEEVFDPPPKYCEEELPPTYEEALKIEIV